MLDKFTDRARKVMQLATQEAQRFNHEYIGTEHILLGLIAENSGVAANVLKNLDIDLYRVRSEIELIVQAGPDMVSIGRLPQTPRAKKVIEFAIEESRKLGHEYVGTEHLLLGLLRDDGGVASQVLLNMGLHLDQVRDEVLNILATPQIHEANPGTIASIATAAPESNLKHLPQYAREIAQEFDQLIAMMQRAKEDLIADQDFDRAADVRDLEKRIRKYAGKFIDLWPRDRMTDR